LATWAEGGVLDNLILVIDATMALERPGAIGTVLHYLIRSDVLDTLNLWSDESSTAAQLYALAVRLSTADAILSKYQPLPEAKTARLALPPTRWKTLHLPCWPLVIHIRTNQRLYQHFERLRLWVLIHALERATQNLLYDRYLRYVADRLRLGGDGEEAWLRLVEKLASGAQGYSAFELQIDNKVQHQLGDPDLTKSARLFLQSLSHVSRMEMPPDAEPVAGLLSRLPLIRRPLNEAATP
jgi:hypothetical protein